MKSLLLLLTGFHFFSLHVAGQPVVFPLVTAKEKVTILYDPKGPSLDSVSAHLLSADIERVSAYRPLVLTDLGKAKGYLIVIGAASSALLQQFSSMAPNMFSRLSNQWESYGMKVLNKPANGIPKALLIAGSDARGTAYGVFSLSEKIGVSPWYWWADVPVVKKKEVVIRQEEYVSAPPSVKYRGIFINDEDWGLLPWAAQTFEPEKKNIGPKTYAQVFELLLRLKANLIWPAMHPGTKPFFADPQNKAIAETYAIVVGSSHAEPMLRNNVGEWDEKTMGAFNYITNREKVYSYWKERVKETKGMEAMFSLGMRGVHDSGMEGIKSAKEAVPLLEKIFADQRGLLQEQITSNIGEIPQVFTAYKEVLDIYDNGLKLPQDVTIVWPDDNYGYIKRLNNPKEKNRQGGTGVYYHASYWGRPHDYLWLGTTHPLLIESEMMKAYHAGADRLWVLNVGDIKPLEYSTQLFLDMAYNANPFNAAGFAQTHLQNWLLKVCQGFNRVSLYGIMKEYYDLAFERRPEFMGWSQTEPTTGTASTAYNHFSFGDEAQRRLDRYAALQEKARVLLASNQSKDRDAFYQLVYYPVVCAAWMNQKFLYGEKAMLYAKQDRISAYDYASLATAAYDSIVAETNFYNEKLSNGKWKGMMSMAPRNLPVFHQPKVTLPPLKKEEKWDAAPEGYDTTAYVSSSEKRLPTFVSGMKQHYFIDVYLMDSSTINWKATTSADWISLSQQSGMLQPMLGKNTVRLLVEIDWNKIPKKEKLEGNVFIQADGKEVVITIPVSQPKALSQYRGFVETNGFVSIHAANNAAVRKDKSSAWQMTPTPGDVKLSYTSSVAETFSGDTASIRKNAAFVAYTFYSTSAEECTISLYTLPTHPLNNQFSMRYGMSIDDGPVRIVDTKTIGRSEEWKQNVLCNSAITKIGIGSLLPGKHTVKLYAIDPGVVLSRILLTFGKVPVSYSLIPETKKR
ncbi:MAG TPA: glycosyl hydrolase 115 family protein [Flavisolibacter sp.]|jgi:hypothetical protein|nr:glycosyl hydrolase 115 family protein [Flavisolibacter sp.]